MACEFPSYKQGNQSSSKKSFVYLILLTTHIHLFTINFFPQSNAATSSDSLCDRVSSRWSVRSVISVQLYRSTVLHRANRPSDLNLTLPKTNWKKQPPPDALSVWQDHFHFLSDRTDCCIWKHLLCSKHTIAMILFLVWLLSLNASTSSVSSTIRLHQSSSWSLSMVQTYIYTVYVTKLNLWFACLKLCVLI